MTHMAMTLPWTATGARAVSPRMSRATRPSGARAVQTRRGYALFDDLGHYVGSVAAPVGRISFGQGADTVLLHRNLRGGAEV
jgi:hypothetical protein